MENNTMSDKQSKNIKEGEKIEAKFDQQSFLIKINKKITENEEQLIVDPNNVHDCELKNRYTNLLMETKDTNILLKEMKMYLESKEEQEGQQPSTSTGGKRKKLISTAKTWCEVCQIEVCSSYYKAHCKSGKHLDMLQDLKATEGKNK
ncbi:hypothetical protein Mgra_00007989 [Meloidogyne graminicola]|uniref:U1-type domain-containing protein n=1 Tax=Meloidogyne graminicola TaxID=189291 RepID=A0A8S9ZGZ8_9BILA|nr:hypothetical protein Mgra_00007989 [Meloidogyne graminicola]